MREARRPNVEADYELLGTAVGSVVEERSHVEQS